MTLKNGSKWHYSTWCNFFKISWLNQTIIMILNIQWNSIWIGHEYLMKCFLLMVYYLVIILNSSYCLLRFNTIFLYNKMLYFVIKQFHCLKPSLLSVKSMLNNQQSFLEPSWQNTVMKMLPLVVKKYFNIMIW